IPSRPVDSVAPPWMLAPSSPPWSISPPAPLGPLIPPAPPGSVVDHKPPHNSTPPPAPHASGCQALPCLQLHFGPLLLRLHRGLPDPHLSRRNHLLRLGPPDPPASSCVTLAGWLSTSGSTTSCSTAIDQPLESTLPPPWLLPLSAPLWVTFIAAVWVLLGSSRSRSLPSPSWLLPPSDPPWLLLFSLRHLHPGLCSSSPSQVSILRLNIH
ncbi:hypothetical protein M9458_036927, partial [Cirrhinus mrigala]